MPRGGKREGAGRKTGSANKVQEEARKKALASGISPLDLEQLDAAQLNTLISYLNWRTEERQRAQRGR